jgi:hypothetical protein
MKNKIEKKWTRYGQEHLEGKTVERVRYLSKEEAQSMGWYSRPLVIEFTDGSLVFASQDDEGNDGGALFGQGPGGEELTFPVLR